MRKLWLAMIVSGLSAGLIAGCGGGGGGGSAAIQYTGITSAAVLSDNNAETIALQAFQAGDVSTSTSGLITLSVDGGTTAGAPAPLSIVRLLEKAVGSIPPQTGTSARTASAQAATPMTTVSQTVSDGMGGSITYSLTVNDTTGDFYGSFTFNTWHGDAGEIFSGVTGVSGNIDIGTGMFTAISFSFHPVTFTDGTGSYTLYGSVSLTVGSTSGSAVLDLVLLDGGTGDSVWIQNYQVDSTFGPDNDLDGVPDYVDEDVTGRVYLSGYGYVDVSTPTMFRYYAGYDIPSRGQMVATGDGGNSLRLTVNEAVPVSSTYYVEADVDGQPGYEWLSVDHTWN